MTTITVWVLMASISVGGFSPQERNANARLMRSYKVVTVDNIATQQECLRLGQQIRRQNLELVTYRCYAVKKAQ